MSSAAECVCEAEVYGSGYPEPCGKPATESCIDASYDDFGRHTVRWFCRPHWRALIRMTAERGVPEPDWDGT